MILEIQFSLDIFLDPTWHNSG